MSNPTALINIQLWTCLTWVSVHAPKLISFYTANEICVKLCYQIQPEWHGFALCQRKESVCQQSASMNPCSQSSGV